MASVPIKTGMTVFFPEYGVKFLRADMYRVGSTYVFVGTVFYSKKDDQPFDVEVTLEGNTIVKELSGDQSIVVVPVEACIVHNKELVR